MARKQSCRVIVLHNPSIGKKESFIGGVLVVVGVALFAILPGTCAVVIIAGVLYWGMGKVKHWWHN